MDWEGKAESSNVEDRRGNAGPAVAAGGGLVTIIAVALAYFMGIDPNKAKQIAGGIANQVGGAGQRQNAPPTNDVHLRFSKAILGMTETVWSNIFQQEYRKPYEKPGMVLFANQVDSEGCGIAPSAVGPFYCPASRKVFLDPDFFNELEAKLGGDSGDASRAYVIAHEVGHHIQNLLGYNAMVESFRKREGENGGIRLELQADYLAGVWAHHAEQRFGTIFDRGDLQSIIKTAQSIGDDRIQKKMKGKAWPESFNHGKAEQRLKYFLEGMKTGDARKQSLDRFFNQNVAPLDL
ncbi:MAG: neutral zinc metallopeptidase [Gemmataceae bacterium]|nr:neutral zinc metallopeptidase [Gemmataceae bacterium]